MMNCTGNPRHCRTVYLAIVAAAVMSGCTTIPIREKDAFDIKRTVTPQTFQRDDAVLEEVTIAVNEDTHLRAWFLRCDSARGTLLHFGGNGFLLVTSYHLVNTLADLRMNALLFDYRGYGRSDGVPSVDSLKSDALTVYKYLVSRRDVDPRTIIIHGHSMGSFLACHLASRVPSAGLLLESPITDVEDWTGRLVPWMLKPFVSFDIEPPLRGESNTERVAALSVPLLLIVGDQDKITPAAMAEELLEGSPSSMKRLVIVPEGGHNDLPSRTVYRAALEEFFEAIFPSVPR